MGRFRKCAAQELLVSDGVRVKDFEGGVDKIVDDAGSLEATIGEIVEGADFSESDCGEEGGY